MTNTSEIEMRLRESLGLELPVDSERNTSRYGGLHHELSHAIIGAAIEVHRHLGPGQLESELEASAWLVCEVDRDLIFNTPPDEMWEKAIRRLGADPASLQMSRGVH